MAHIEAQSIRKLQDAAKLRVRFGEIDEIKRQHVALINSNRMIEVTDIEVAGQGRFVDSIGNLTSGLIIHEIILDENGSPIRRGLGVEVARGKTSVCLQSYDGSSRLSDEDLSQLTHRIRVGDKIEHKKYVQAVGKLHRKSLGF